MTAIEPSLAKVPGSLRQSDPGKRTAPPVFILTSGQCAGGGLLQKMITSSKEIMVWNGAGGALHHTLESLRQLDLAASPAMIKVLGGGSTNASKKAVPRGADLRPIVSNLRLNASHVLRSYRFLFRRLYEAPAQAHGFARWGLIETSGDRFVIDMLKHLYPKARFIFLVRDPVACLSEIRGRKLQPRDGWGKAMPNPRIVWFAKQWASLAREFATVEGGLKIRFEELVGGSETTKSLNAYLQISMADDFVTRWSADAKSRLEFARLDKATLLKVAPIIDEQRRLWKYD